MLNTAPKSLPSLPNKQPLIIKKRHAQILTAVRALRFVTITDIQKLLFTYPTASKQAGKILSSLAGGDDYLPRHYLFRFPLPDTKPGNPTRIYTLGSLGLAFIKRELGMAINWSFHPDKLQHMNYYPLQHALTLTRLVNDLKSEQVLPPMVNSTPIGQPPKPLLERMVVRERWKCGREVRAPLALDLHEPTWENRRDRFATVVLDPLLFV